VSSVQIPPRLIPIDPLGPANYDFKGTRAIAKLDGDIDPEVAPNDSISENENKDIETCAVDASSMSAKDGILLADGSTVSRQLLKSGFKKAAIYSSVLAAIVTIIGEANSNFSQLYSDDIFI